MPEKYFTVNFLRTQTIFPHISTLRFYNSVWYIESNQYIFVNLINRIDELLLK